MRFLTPSRLVSFRRLVYLKDRRRTVLALSYLVLAASILWLRRMTWEQARRKTLLTALIWHSTLYASSMVMLRYGLVMWAVLLLEGEWGSVVHHTIIYPVRVNVMFEQRWQVLEMSAHWVHSHLELLAHEHLYHGMSSTWVPVVIHTLSSCQFVKCMQQFYLPNNHIHTEIIIAHMCHNVCHMYVVVLYTRQKHAYCSSITHLYCITKWIDCKQICWNVITCKYRIMMPKVYWLYAKYKVGIIYLYVFNAKTKIKTECTHSICVW